MGGFVCRHTNEPIGRYLSRESDLRPQFWVRSITNSRACRPPVRADSSVRPARGSRPRERGYARSRPPQNRGDPPLPVRVRRSISLPQSGSFAFPSRWPNEINLLFRINLRREQLASFVAGSQGRLNHEDHAGHEEHAGRAAHDGALPSVSHRAYCSSWSSPPRGRTRVAIPTTELPRSHESAQGAFYHFALVSAVCAPPARILHLPPSLQPDLAVNRRPLPSRETRRLQPSLSTQES
jgi:hypothetical protein